MISHLKDIVQPWMERAKRHEIEIILGIGVALVSLLSFAIGYLTAKEQLKEPIRLEQLQEYGAGQ